MKKRNVLWIFLAGLIPCALFVVGIIEVGKLPFLSDKEEIQMGAVIVLSAAMLITLLTLMAMVFERLGLADKSQALGLPEGSIRSLIALLLLMAFVIFSIYLFRSVVAFNWEYKAGISQEQKEALGPAVFSATEVKTAGETKAGETKAGETKAGETKAPSYNVWIRVKDSNVAGEQFAHQVFTALLTLVTAVSAFDFGARGAEVAKDRAQRESTDFEKLAVTSIEPGSAAATKGKVVIRKLVGAGFLEGAKVKLTCSGQPEVLGTSVEVISGKRIICEFDLSGKQAGKWDVIVVNPDNNEAKGASLFEIT